MGIFDSARFVTSAAAKINQLPGAGLPEIAFAGRSNAGKSTTINVLTRQGRLAFASKTPGRTQLVNFFGLSRRLPESSEREQIGFLVDLPGYGYAKTAPEIRETWSALVGGYRNPPLHLPVSSLSSIRIAPSCRLTNGSLTFFHHALMFGNFWLINKCDQIKRAERAKVLSAARARATKTGSQISVQLFSGLKKEGVEELQTTLISWIDPEGRLGLI